MLLVVLAGLFSVRVFGPPHLTDNDQERPASHALDVYANGSLLVQRDWTGMVASKPPLFAWGAAAAAAPFGRMSYATLYAPCLVAVAAVVFGLRSFGGRAFGARAGLLAAAFFALSPIGAKQVAMARSDGLFAAAVAFAAFAACRAWLRGGGWTPAWAAATVATFAKGPLGVVLAASGLLAAAWERRSGFPAPLRGSHGRGVALLLVAGGGWFVASWAAVGDPFIERVVRRELVGHAFDTVYGGFGGGFVRAPFYLVTRFLPWSLPALAGLVRVLRRPDPDPTTRRIERFVACWMVGGLVPFCFATHQRPDLVLPLVPAAALLAGREVDRLLRRLGDRRFFVAVAASSVLLVAGYAVRTWIVDDRSATAREGRDLEAVAKGVRRSLGDAARLAFVDAPYALQFHLGMNRRAVEAAEAARLLAAGAADAVAAGDADAFRRAYPAEGPPLRVVAAAAPDAPRPVVVFAR